MCSSTIYLQQQEQGEGDLERGYNLYDLDKLINHFDNQFIHL